jgi:hypothetical protein
MREEEERKDALLVGPTLSLPLFKNSKERSVP